MQWKLIRLRSEHKETQEDLAKLINISESGYRNKERGESQFKSNEMFTIARHYGKTLEEIFLPTKYTLSELEEEEV